MHRAWAWSAALPWKRYWIVYWRRSAAISERVGQATGARLCGLLKATSPRIYKDQLVALRGLLNSHPDLPQALLDRLIDRPVLTASQCREYFEAYAADPGRFVDPADPGDPHERQ